MNWKLFKNEKLLNITSLKRNSILSKTDNPAAMFTKQEITVLNNENRSFTIDERELIESLILKEKSYVNKS